MAITQLSVFLMNQPGALVDAVSAISGAGANIRAMSIAEANDFGILRIIVSDSDRICKLLGDKYLISKTEVVATAEEVLNANGISTLSDENLKL